MPALTAFPPCSFPALNLPAAGGDVPARVGRGAGPAAAALATLASPRPGGGMNVMLLRLASQEGCFAVCSGITCLQRYLPSLR